MVRKISLLILSVSILVVGAISFSKLGYWDKSIRVFRFSADEPFSGRVGGDHGARGDFAGRETHNVANTNKPDVLMQKSEPQNRERNRTGSFRGDMRNGDGHGRGELQSGGKIRLKNVSLFLAVFASFTIMTLYFYKGICHMRKRNAMKECIEENE